MLQETLQFKTMNPHFELISDNGSKSKGSDLAESMYELNNLLSIVLSHSTIAMSKLPHNSPARDNLERVQDAAERLADLLLQMNLDLQDEDYVADISVN